MNDRDKIRIALSNTGVEVNDIYDLVNCRNPYPKAIPVLINLLKEGIDDDRENEGLIRALAVKEAKGVAGSVLINEYNSLPKDKSILRWTIGNTMQVIMQDEDIDDVLNIVSDKANGTSRQMFVLALGKTRRADVEQILLRLLDDEDVIKHAIASLVKLKSVAAKAKLEILLQHNDALVRKEATKALKQISAK